MSLSTNSVRISLVGHPLPLWLGQVAKVYPTSIYPADTAQRQFCYMAKKPKSASYADAGQHKQIRLMASKG